MNEVKRNTETPARPLPALLPPVDVIEDASGITLYAEDRKSVV